MSLGLRATVGSHNSGLMTSVTSTNIGRVITDGAARDPFVIITRNHVVVAHTPDGAQVPFALVNWGVRARVTRAVWITTSACTPPTVALPAGSPLPAGSYQVWAVQQVWRDVDGHLGISTVYSRPLAITIH